MDDSDKRDDDDEVVVVVREVMDVEAPESVEELKVDVKDVSADVEVMREVESVT